MFFKRSQPGSTPESTTSLRATADGQATAAAAKPQPLEAAELRRAVTPSSLGFKTTDDLIPVTGLIGQERALKAIQFGIDMKSHDFNMFVLGPPASGKTTAVRAHLGPKAAEAPHPARLGLRLQFRDAQPPEGFETARTGAPRRWPRA